MAPSPSASPSLLRRLLLSAGYHVEEVRGALLAVRGIDHRGVLIASRARSPVELEPLFPASLVHRTIVYDDEPGEAARGAAAERGLELLDPSALGPALGELLLPSVLVPGSIDGTSLGEEPLESPFPPGAGGARTIRPRIDRREAQVLAGLTTARYTLRLVPHYVAAYRVRTVTARGLSGAVQRRLVAVNATSRRAETWAEGLRELVADGEVPGERLAPQLSEPAAAALALEAVRRFHTVRVDHTEQHAGAIVVESRRLAPPAEDVRLGPFSLIYVPYWYAETSDGRRVLDAVNGRGATEGDLRAE
jgi:hypothetical protein